MVSNLVREKLKPLLFKNLKLDLDVIKYDCNVITIANYNRYINKEYDYTILREKNNRSIEDSVNDFVVVLNDIKKYTKRFYYRSNRNAGYYLYPLIRTFNNLTELKIDYCKIPFRAFADIGKTLPNINKLELRYVCLIKSTTDTISEKDLTFPPNLSYLKFSYICVASRNLSDPLEFLHNNERESYSESFTLPNTPIPTLKRLYFASYKKENHRLEEFLEVNPNVESLYTHNCNLNLISSLNSLKSLGIDDNISFNSIDQDFKLNSINSLTLSTGDFNYSENFIKLCQLCPNLVDLNLMFSETPNFSIIDKYLASDLTKLQRLKTLVIANHCEYNYCEDHILDFTKFAQIEKLKVDVFDRSLLTIKFENCKSLKRVELIGCVDIFNYEFERKFNQHKNWVFNFGENSIKGYKI